MAFCPFILLAIALSVARADIQLSTQIKVRAWLSNQLWVQEIRT